MNWKDKVILLTGGTGSFGQKFTEVMLSKYRPKVIRIFSRDELKQWEMERRINNDKRLRFFIGDVRDKDRLERAMDGADIVVHAAALKQVPLCEYNPFEAIKTNILGAQNVIEAAIDHNIEKVIAISSDKAVNPVNLYGATKMCMEKIFIAANAYVGKKRQTKISCARYGNVMGSRGSVIPLLKKQKSTGTITITDKRMTRFWITLEQGVEFVVRCIEMMRGAEIFVPKVPSMKVIDLARSIAPKCKIKYIGIRPGEKIHECLITEDETGHAREYKNFFVITPEYLRRSSRVYRKGSRLLESFRYASDSNKHWLTEKELQKTLRKLK
ncbi:MAG: UDP-N-acetylglucosamine 4,6-dehydratase (inverting) [Candidatus Omnitrophota bacterium]|jgi:UDP-N-acetylglucosamine 4,6-dehydratase (inverting)